MDMTQEEAPAKNKGNAPPTADQMAWAKVEEEAARAKLARESSGTKPSKKTLAKSKDEPRAKSGAAVRSKVGPPVAKVAQPSPLEAEPEARATADEDIWAKVEQEAALAKLEQQAQANANEASRAEASEQAPAETKEATRTDPEAEALIESPPADVKAAPPALGEAQDAPLAVAEQEDPTTVEADAAARVAQEAAFAEQGAEVMAKEAAATEANEAPIEAKDAARNDPHVKAAPLALGHAENEPSAVAEQEDPPKVEVGAAVERQAALGWLEQEAEAKAKEAARPSEEAPAEAQDAARTDPEAEALIESPPVDVTVAPKPLVRAEDELRGISAQTEQAATVAAADALAKAFEATAAETMDYSKKSLENGYAFVAKLLTADSLESAALIPSEYAKGSGADFIAYLAKIGELYARFAGEIFGRCYRIV